MNICLTLSNTNLVSVHFARVLFMILCGTVFHPFGMVRALRVLLKGPMLVVWQCCDTKHTTCKVLTTSLNKDNISLLFLYKFTFV